MAIARRPGRLLLGAAAAGVCLQSLRGLCFVPPPQAATQAPAAAVEFNPMVATSAALPVLTMLAEDAEAKYGDARKWSSVLVPLTTLVFPAVLFGSFVLYSFSEDAFYQLIPGSKKSEEKVAAWREHPVFANIKDPMDGLVNKYDFDQGLEEAWEKAKPKGSTVTAKEKLKELSMLNAPHYWQNKIVKSA
eukprot:CAMPEP_0197871164 /NCGR_PEP_ID=MMETSP1439-20131203/1665_1 /TAXON_ID=66791 /ORGANISM="Gonyaulax spinifera, Strain CCMP409" /LENGTH=189 /DNA_ID=CAMNT_0043490095 /DNA_START=67 /DNA_END=636 /DNA_ORIENTATION=-